MKTAAVIMPVTHSRIADFVTLTKPRLNSLVVVTAGLGYYLGAGGQIEASMLFHTVVGAALVAGGAAAFNQVAERDLDELTALTRWPALTNRSSIVCIRIIGYRYFPAGLRYELDRRICRIHNTR